MYNDSKALDQKYIFQVLAKDVNKIYKVSLSYCFCNYFRWLKKVYFFNFGSDFKKPFHFFIQEIGLVADSLKLGGAILKVIHS